MKIFIKKLFFLILATSNVALAMKIEPTDNSEFFLAIEDSNKDNVVKYIEEAQNNPSTVNYSSFIEGALSHAVYSNQPELTKIIFEQLKKAVSLKIISPDIFAREICIGTQKEPNILFISTYRGYDEISKIILKEIIEALDKEILTLKQFAQIITRTNKNGYSPLIYTIKWAKVTGNQHITKQLSDAGREYLSPDLYHEFIHAKQKNTDWTPYDFFIAQGIDLRDLTK